MACAGPWRAGNTRGSPSIGQWVVPTPRVQRSDSSVVREKVAGQAIDENRTCECFLDEQRIIPQRGVQRTQPFGHGCIASDPLELAMERVPRNQGLPVPSQQNRLLQSLPDLRLG